MAAILAVLLKEEFPQVRALGYASASAVSSKELSESCVDYVSSMTTGKDIFGRLSWWSLTNLRERVLNTLRRCKVNKFTILTSFFRPNFRARDYLYSEDEVPQDDSERKRVQEWIERFRDNFPVKQDPEASALLLPIQRIPMFMPGKVFYLEKKQTELEQQPGNRRCCLPRKTFKYQATQVTDRAEMQNIQVTSRLILDHMPSHLVYAINQCLKDKQQESKLTVKE